MSNEIQQSQGSTPALTFDPGKIDVIRQTVAKGATNNELEMFLHLCSTYQLDPFRKEIWFIKYGGANTEPTIMTSRDGYLKIAQQHPDYRGIMSAEVRGNDYFELDAAAGTVVHKFAQPISNRGPIVGAWATVKRKGMDPVSVFVNMDEYRGNSKIWKQYPSAMIIKVAETFALKRQFGITGLVTREEMDVQGDYSPQAAAGAPQGSPGPNTHQQQQKAHSEPPESSQHHQEQTDPGGDIVPTNEEVVRVSQELGWQHAQLMQNLNTWIKMKNLKPVERWKELTPGQMIEFFGIMWRKLQKQKGGEQQ
jgi:phage recombination protein Bet